MDGTHTTLDSLAASWARLGAMFNVVPADGPVDVEQLMLEAVRAGAANSRLFIMAATWLASYSHYVDEARLARLVRDDLELEHRPALGLLLESACPPGDTRPPPFVDTVAACETAVAATDPRPLFDADRRSPLREELVQRRASALSRKWGRWAQDIELKFDALRPEHWVIASNPGIAARRTGRADGRR